MSTMSRSTARQRAAQREAELGAASEAASRDARDAMAYSPPFAQYILSLPTLMNEIKHFSRNF